MLKKFIQIFIFASYWLCFVPWLVILLIRQKVIDPQDIMDYFIQYTTLLFVLIVIYWLINRIVDHCYIKHEVKKRVRKITMKRQLERLERGEIDIHEAQNLRTFISANKPKSPKGKRAPGVAGKKTKPKEMQVFAANKSETQKSGIEVTKTKAPTAPTVSTELPHASELPPYSDEMSLLQD